jgi:hypothetical protein
MGQGFSFYSSFSLKIWNPKCQRHVIFRWLLFFKEIHANIYSQRTLPKIHKNQMNAKTDCSNVYDAALKNMKKCGYSLIFLSDHKSANSRLRRRYLIAILNYQIRDKLIFIRQSANMALAS